MNKTLTAASTIAAIAILALTGCGTTNTEPAPTTPVVVEETPTEAPVETPTDNAENNLDLTGGHNIVFPETAPFTAVYKGFTITCEPDAGYNPTDAYVVLNADGSEPSVKCLYDMSDLFDE